MTFLRIEARTAAVTRRLMKVRQTLGDLEPVLEDIAEGLVRTTKRRFYEQRGPTGRPWRRTKAARREKRRTLLRSGRLRESITSQATADTAEVGSPLPYAKERQFAGRTKRPREQRRQQRRAARLPSIGAIRGPSPRDALKLIRARAKTARKPSGVYIPGRPFLGISSKDRVAMRKTVAAHIRKAAK